MIRLMSNLNVVKNQGLNLGQEPKLRETFPYFLVRDRI